MVERLKYIPILGSLIIWFRLLKEGPHQYDQRFSKKPLWMRGKTAKEIRSIKLRVMWRRFDTQTRGQGLILVLLMGVFFSISFFGWVGQSITGYINQLNYQSQYHNALKIACTDKTFYSYHFVDCETAKIRPSFNTTK